MKIYDITRPLLSTPVYLGDPKPELIDTTPEGASYTLHTLSMCLHNGTHVDAPAHFRLEKTIGEIPLEHFIGSCEVREIGDLRPVTEKRVLLKGEGEISLEEARFYAEQDILLLGVEACTVGGEDNEKAHRALLDREIVILENLDLSAVPTGKYTLSALPLKLEGAEASPVRAVLFF